MSTIKTDALTSVTTNTDLTLSANGTGGVKVSDYFQLTKGADISSATSLTLGTDGNAFDVTGTTTITSIATQGIGSHITLHFDGALTFTHHSTNLILPGAANITTAAGDIAVMYEYASADWRCISYTKASGAAVVAGGFTLGTEQTPTSGTTVTFGSIPAGTKFIVINFNALGSDAAAIFNLQIGDAGGIETAGYLNTGMSGVGAVLAAVNETGPDGDASIGWTNHATHELHGIMYLALEDSSAFTWCWSSGLGSENKAYCVGGVKSLSAELTQLMITISAGAFDTGSINIMYQ